MFEIKVTNLVKQYHQQEVLNIDQLTLHEGEVVGIIGCNGSGKTTLAEIILGTKQKTSGTIEYSKNFKELRRNAVFQESSFDTEVNLKYLYFFYQQIFQQTKRKDVERQKRDFETYGLTGAEKKSYKALSGGQKQRFKVMISMLNDPELVLYDEVGNSLDLKTKKMFNETLIKKKSEQNGIILMISHDPNEIYNLCSRVIKLEDHHIVFDRQVKTEINGVEVIQALMEDD
jgi:ABC-2 type transport system ATP-binding protein